MATDDVAGILILIGLIPATIAQRKGANFLKFWFFGSLLFVLVHPYVLSMERDAYGRLRRHERQTSCPMVGCELTPLLRSESLTGRMSW
jgi:hypothetical protein